MWASAQRDGRPAEYRWRPVLNAAKFGWRRLLDCRAVTLIIPNNSRRKCIYSLISQGRGQTLCKVWLASVERRRCSNEAKMRKPLKLAGVPQTNETISAAGRLKFTILWGHVKEVLLLNIFFRLSIRALIAKIARQICVSPWKLPNLVK